MTETVFVALGSNLGDRAGNLASARAALALLPATRMVAASRVEETAPFGFAPQSPYLNQMVALETSLSPEALLDRLLHIERSLGRVRTQRWGPRPIDLDIVQFGQRVLNDSQLIIPHPGLKDRDFWQREASELNVIMKRRS